MSIERHCHYCGREVKPGAPNVLQRIEGWEARGGRRPSGHHLGSDIYLRQGLDSYACAPCISKLRSGLAIEQESLQL
jgi:hypothetical protein